MRMVTLKDVAAAAGVSTVTVSSILSGVNRVRVSQKTAERIRAIAKEMNYVPLAAARGLRTGKTDTIAFVSSTHGMFSSDDMWHEALRGVSDFMWGRGERLMLVMSRDRGQELETIRQLAFGRQVDGFVVQSPGGDDESINLLKTSGRPFVVIGGCPRPDVNTVTHDMHAFATDIAESLRDCSGIVLLLAAFTDDTVYSVFLDAFAGWSCRQGIRCEMWRGAFIPDAAWLKEFHAGLGGGKVGVALLRGLLPETVNALEEAGLGLGVESAIAYVSTGEEVMLPPDGLTVMHFDNYTLGRRAARRLMALVDSGADAAGRPENIVVPAAQPG